MNRVFSTLTLAVLLVGPLAAQPAKEDIVILKDRRETGSVEEYDFNVLKFKPKGGSTQNIKAGEVRSVDFSSAPKEMKEAEAAIQAGRDEDAIGKLQDFLGKKSKKALRQEAMYLLAGAQLRTGKTDEGIATLKAIISDGEFPSSRYLEAILDEVAGRLLSAGKADDAIAFLEKEANRVAKLPEAGAISDHAKLMRARIMLQKGDKAGAKREATVLAGGSGAGASEAKALLGDLALVDNDVPGAEKLYRESLAGTGNAATKAAAWNGLGQIKYDKGIKDKKSDLLKEALLSFLRGVVQFPPGSNETSASHETALFRAGRCFQGMGELEKPGDVQTRFFNRARELYRRLRDTYPTSVFAEEAKQNLERLGG